MQSLTDRILVFIPRKSWGFCCFFFLSFFFLSIRESVCFTLPWSNDALCLVSIMGGNLFSVYHYYMEFFHSKYFICLFVVVLFCGEAILTLSQYR